MIFNELTAGASNDIERATMLARRMVVDFGMSSLGPVSLGLMVENNGWGYSYGDTIKLSDAMQNKVDLEIKSLMDTAYSRAETILKKNIKLLDKISEQLIKVETLEQEVFEELVGKPKAMLELK